MKAAWPPASSTAVPSMRVTSMISWNDQLRVGWIGGPCATRVAARGSARAGAARVITPAQAVIKGRQPQAHTWVRTAAHQRLVS
jgi:hypothetical protein